MQTLGGMRIQVSDPALVADLVDFLWESGFVAEPEDGYTVKVSVSSTRGNGRTEAETDLYLKVWLDLSLRVWRSSHPRADALVVG